jgi:hypothetical protein
VFDSADAGKANQAGLLLLTSSAADANILGITEARLAK